MWAKSSGRGGFPRDETDSVAKTACQDVNAGQGLAHLDELHRVEEVASDDVPDPGKDLPNDRLESFHAFGNRAVDRWRSDLGLLQAVFPLDEGHDIGDGILQILGLTVVGQDYPLPPLVETRLPGLGPQFGEAVHGLPELPTPHLGKMPSTGRRLPEARSDEAGDFAAGGFRLRFGTTLFGRLGVRPPEARPEDHDHQQCQAWNHPSIVTSVLSGNKPIGTARPGDQGTIRLRSTSLPAPIMISVAMLLSWQMYSKSSSPAIHRISNVAVHGAV